MSDDSPVRAAGVVLVREHDGHQEFLAVHRPERQDWSLPKGKLETGEHVITAAMRECDEETGIVPVLGTPLPTQRYRVLDAPKEVDYWRAWVRSDEGFVADDEIDEICWARVAEAPSVLSYPADVLLVAQAVALPVTVPLVILRHTQAIKRSDFHGPDDDERPLAGKGRSQSKALVALLDAFGVEVVHSSSATRCLETVRRFAKQIGAQVHAEPALTEEAHRADPELAAQRAVALAHTPEALVLCTHRPVLPTILDILDAELAVTTVPDPGRQAGKRELWDPKLPPGGFIVIHRTFAPDGTVRALGLERHSVQPIPTDY